MFAKEQLEFSSAFNILYSMMKSLAYFKIKLCLRNLDDKCALGFSVYKKLHCLVSLTLVFNIFINVEKILAVYLDDIHI